jgi:hypothetical protein
MRRLANGVPPYRRGEIVNEDQLEPEVLSYREFRNRDVLRAWEQRWMRYERTLSIDTQEECVASGFGWIRSVVERLSGELSRNA